MEGMPAYDAFLLVSFGGPESPDEVMPFLENVTRGRGVPPERLASVAEHYYAFGGVSPINQQCRDMLAAVRADFSAAGLSLPVYWGNRNWDPYLADTVRAMAADGVRRAVAFVTSAYSSYSSCRQYLDDIERARAAAGPRAPVIDKIRRFFNHPGFIEPFAANARAALATLPAGLREDAHLVFTAHSIPVAMADASGPGGGRRYVAELTEAARLITERTDGGTHPWTLAYQSRSGPPSQPWLEPDVRDHLGELAKSGTRAVVVIPAGFVSDHMEVRHDLDVEAARSAESLGLAFARAATPGTHPRFASMITELVRERLALPDSTVPDSTVPDSIVPDSTVPDSTVPDSTVPDSTVPDSTVPDNPTLDSTVPDNSAQGNAVPLAALGDLGVPSQTCPADCCRQAASA
jgi:ferrochelatase